MSKDVVSDVFAGYSSARSTFLSVIPPQSVGCGWRCVYWVFEKNALVHWHQHSCHIDKRAETGRSSDRGVCMLSITIYGFVLIAETASADKQMVW